MIKCLDHIIIREKKVLTLSDKALILTEEAFSKRLMNSISNDAFCRDLGTALSQFDFAGKQKSFTVNISTRAEANKFFGVRVLPDIKNLDEFCREFINKEIDGDLKYPLIAKSWQNITDWVIEIDPQVLDRNVISLTPKELTALTLHEIGHIVFSERPIGKFYRAFKDAQRSIKLNDRSSQKIMYSIYMLPIVVACMQRAWTNSKNEMRVSILADKSIADLGYQEYLAEALNKIIKHYGNINYSNASKEAEIEAILSWCNQNVIDVMKRKTSMKDQLYYQAIESNSIYMKQLTIVLLNVLGAKLRERYTGYVIENSMEILSDPKVKEKYEFFIPVVESAKLEKRLELVKASPATEGLFNKRKKIKAVLPSQYEVDAIAIEIDRIENQHDRIFVLDLIYELLERVEIFEEAVSHDPLLLRKWEGKINAMKEELMSYRKAVLEKKIVEKNYKFLVKLPAVASDYEG